MTVALHDQNDPNSEIFGSTGEYEQPNTEPKEFKPWHRPRKQFVRREQLSKLLQRLYANRDPGEPLRYLGLPGTDLLDLRYLYEQLCCTTGRPLRFLGFNSEALPNNHAGVELNISLDEVRRLANVDRQSLVLHDDFRRIGNRDSIAWSWTRQLGPFDVVNIDLCDGLASDSPGRDGSVYDALGQLAALQARNHNPWLLLIATRMNREVFDAEAEERIIKLFDRNVCNCEGFAEECEQLLNFDARAIDPATCSEADHLKLMIVAIAKWLARLVQVQAPSRVELASTQGYRVNPVAAQMDLVTLALRVEPVIAVSPDALSPTSPTMVDECATALAILKRSARRRNVDTILQQNPQEREQSIKEMERLLEQARYDPAAYRAWLASECSGAAAF